MRIGAPPALGRFLRDARGSVAIMTAAMGLCAIASLAIGVDVGSLYLERRTAQGAVDMAAVAAARDLASAERAARATLALNGVAAPRSFRLTFGRYRPGAAAPADRFQPNVAPFNAVRVEISKDAPLFFGRAIAQSDAMTVSTAAIAVNTELAALSVGSRLASLDGGIANALLSGLLGGSVSLSVMDYDALATANVEVLKLLDAVGVKAGLRAGTYDDVLASSLKVGDVIGALATVDGLGVAAKVAVGHIARSADPARRVDLRKLFALGAYGGQAIDAPGGRRFPAAVSALDLLNAVAQVAGGGRQVDLNLGAQLPGLLGLTASVLVGERPRTSPWLAMDRAGGVTVRTAQTRLRLVAQVAGSGLLSLASLRLPVALDLAAAEARLTGVSCGVDAERDARIAVAAKPTLAELWVGEPASLAAWNDVAQTPNIEPATVLSALGVEATARAHVAAANVAETTLGYTYADIKALTVKTVTTTNALETTFASLGQSLDIQLPKVPLLGLLTAAVVKPLVRTILAPVGAMLDPVATALLDVLGLSIGEADVVVRGVRCDGAALVG